MQLADRPEMTAPEIDLSPFPKKKRKGTAFLYKYLEFIERTIGPRIEQGLQKTA